MGAENLISKSVIPVIFACLTLSSNAQDRIFTYTYQSTVLNKGQRELEIWNTLRSGREDYYSRFDNRSEFEVGLGGKLQTAFYLNLSSETKTTAETSVKSLENKISVSFSNEWKLKLMDPVANPVGLALYAEYGIGNEEYELEGKVILDKKIRDLTVAANVVYEAEFVPWYSNNLLEWEKENKLDLCLAFGYAITSGFNLTIENAFRNVYAEGGLQHSALFSGIGFSCVKDNFWVNFTVMPQIVSIKGETTSSLNLNEYEKIQFRLLFSFAL
jgi:hypothetical protein